jgi:hypothetical protein
LPGNRQVVVYRAGPGHTQRLLQYLFNTNNEHNVKSSTSLNCGTLSEFLGSEFPPQRVPSKVVGPSKSSSLESEFPQNRVPSKASSLESEFPRKRVPSKASSLESEFLDSEFLDSEFPRQRVPSKVVVPSKSSSLESEFPPK